MRLGRVAAAVISFAIALGAVSLLFWPALADGRILAMGDGLLEALPAFFAPSERWQPAMLAGFPIYADPNKVFWYPLRLLRFVPNGFNAYILAGYAVAAWGTYGYVRGVTGVAAAGIAAALAFSCGGFLISHFGHPMLVQPAAWAAVAVWSLDAYLRLGSERALAALALAEVLCLLSGQPQVAAFTLVVLIAYLVWNGYAGRTRRTLRVYLEGGAAIVLGVAAAALAWLPAIAQGTSSVRSGLGFAAFVLDSLPANHLARTLVYPFAASGGAETIYHGGIVPQGGAQFVETACYAGLGALALLPLAPLGRQRRLALFWLAAALAALALAVGNALPLAAVTYALPGFNLFRIPGRHAFEFTFAIAILAGLGVATIARGERRTLLFAGIGCIAVLAALATLDVAAQDATFAQAPAFTLFASAAAVQLFVLIGVCVIRNSRVAAALACVAVAAGSLPFAATAYWRDSPSADVLAKPGYAGLLERLPRERGQRVYTEGGGDQSELQPNLPFIWGVPDIGGYTPLQSATVRIFLQTGEDGRLLDVAAPSVDLAAVRYFAVPAQSDGVATARAPYGDGDLDDFLSAVRPNAPRSLTLGPSQPRKADRLALVTSLGASVEVRQGATVATATVRDTSGATQTLPLRAGIETAEFAYDRPDVLASVRHRRANLYEQAGENSWYACILPVRLRAPIVSVQIRMIGNGARPDAAIALNLRKISLIDAGSGRAYPFSREAPYFGAPHHFRHVADVEGVAVFENLRSNPAVWIARAVPSALGTANDDEAAALRERLSGIDLRHQALTPEIPALTADMPALPDAKGSARIVRDAAESRDVTTLCSSPCLLVSSMSFTTDWSVAVDGRPSSLVRADGFLQGVALPPGRHMVAFRYEPGAGRTGLALSAGSVALLAAWLVLRRRRNLGGGMPSVWHTQGVP